MKASLGSRNHRPGPGLDAPSYRARDRRSIAALLLVPIALALPACETYRELRAELHPEEAQQPAHLRLLVEPTSGLRILVDGQEVAQRAPYDNPELAAGNHRVEVQAPGFHSFSVSVQLKTGQFLELPMVLRKLPSGELPPAEGAPSSAATPSAPPQGPVPDPPPAPEAAGPTLPPGVEPVRLLVRLQPAGGLVLDGIGQTTGELRLTRTHGKIEAGGMLLRYRRGDAGLLYFDIPGDTATWSRDGRPLAPGGSMLINPGAIRLVRRDAEGNEQILLIKR